MTVQRKAFPVELKTDGLGKGQVLAVVSAFGNVDYRNDRVMKGAFSGTAAKWMSGQNGVLPVVFSHKWDDPWAHIGVTDDLEELDRGLKALYTLDVDDNPLAKHIHRLMERRTLKEHSFAYETVREKRGSDGANELHELELIEIGPTLKGMNPATELLAVKSALEAASGREFARAEVADVFDVKTVAELTVPEFEELLARHSFSPPAGENGKTNEAADVKPPGEDVPASDTELLALQRQINQLRS